MALISCPHCGTEFSDAAPNCPHCGQPNPVTPPPLAGDIPLAGEVGGNEPAGAGGFGAPGSTGPGGNAGFGGSTGSTGFGGAGSTGSGGFGGGPTGPTGPNATATGGAPPEKIPNYLIPAIILTLCCCQPVAIVSIVFAAQVNSKRDRGDIAGARDASKKARLWLIISGVLALVGWGMAMAFGFLSVILAALGAGNG